MKRALLWLSLVSLGWAQEWTGPLDSIRQHALESDYSYRFLSRLCHQVGPRLSGSPAAAAAVDLVAEEMRRLNLKVWRQPCQVPHWVRGREEAELLEYSGKPAGVRAPLVLTTLGGSSSTGARGLEAEVVVVESFAQLEAAQVQGKIVFFNTRFDQRVADQGRGGTAYSQSVVYRTRGPAAASRQGAAACLVRSVGGADYRLPHTGATSFGEARPLPCAALSSEDADRIAYLSKQGAVRLHLVLTPETLPDAPSFNIIGDLEGSDPQAEVVIVSGHLDSWDVGTGALDDASGVATAMQVAQTFRALGLKPRRTLRVIGWMNEENGGAGAQTYDKETQGKNHFAAVESDLGCGHCLGFNCWTPAEWLPALKPVSQALQVVGASQLESTHGTGADISPLGVRGVPCFHPLLDSRTYFHYHHTPADTVDKVDPAHLRQNGAVLSVLAWALCSMDRPASPGIPR
ncbi:MAG: M20/M25/M40 family metallo-hydrolase [Candidatus Eremiobacteraeota bacterium]|nr:M20/M25/M40 family metallo-hydrolase [Candidatus Eremiobacteraeota bacterium]MCW5872868.1 M20/M25/M40 family metallo-hydrolase [Candidatus Eremiobacteraeota bacterium]